jgi:hypothetical protein
MIESSAESGSLAKKLGSSAINTSPLAEIDSSAEKHTPLAGMIGIFRQGRSTFGNWFFGKEAWFFGYQHQSFGKN